MLPVLDKEVVRHRIAGRIARELQDGWIVNLGIGIPTLVSDYLPKETNILIQTENGSLGAGPKPEKEDWRYVGAGGRCISLISGGCFFASDLSFGLIRGGHVDATVLGTLEVDAGGDIANWTIPGKRAPGMGGAMDLLSGARNVYVATTHLSAKGAAKIVQKCTLPLTGRAAVDVIVSEFALFRFIDGRLTLCEIAPEVDVEQLRRHTGAEFAVATDIKELSV